MGRALSEVEALARLRELASKNTVFTSLIGQGYSGTLTPLVILRNILENPAWYTAYTPYQPEISQGRLEALLNFQTMVCELTGLDVANASLLDEGTAAAEAMAVAERVSKAKTRKFFVDENCHPQTIAVLRTRAEPLGWELVIGNPETDLDASDVFGAIFQYPGTDGEIRDFRPAIARLKEAGSLSIMAADPLALAVLTSLANSAPTWPSDRPNVSVYRWATAVRMPPIWLSATLTNAPFRVASSVFPSIPAANRPIA